MRDRSQEWYALCEKWQTSGYDSLSGRERVWLNVRALIDATNDGGLISYFYNSGADTLPDCSAALIRLGASSVATQLRRISDLFPKEALDSIDGRNAVIDSWPDDGRYDAMLEDIDRKMDGLTGDLENRLEVFLASTEENK